MADVTGVTPPDLVWCRHGREWDRNRYSQCNECGADLWNESHLVPPPGSAPASAPPSAGHTVLDAPPPSPGLDIMTCGRVLTLAPGQTLTLGRADDCETAGVFHEAGNVSREHAVLRYDGEQLWVTDTKSRNGTYVDEQRLKADIEYVLRPGQQLRLAANVPIDVRWSR